MTSKSKQRGYYGEQKAVAALERIGITAKRQILSGAHKDYPGDLISQDGREFKWEVKNRTNIPQYLFEYAKQGGADAVALTQAGEEVIFILTAEQFGKLYKEKQ